MAKPLRLTQFAAVCLAILVVLNIDHAQAQSVPQEAAQSVPASSLADIMAVLSTELGLELDQLDAETDLIADIGVDQTRLYYILQELYLDQKVDAPEEELTSIGEIAKYIDRQRQLGVDTRADDDEENAYYTQRVHFATTRNETSDSDPWKRFDGGRISDRKLRYGHADVNIPFDHKPGQIETPWRNIRLLQDNRKHIFITDVGVEDAGSFFADMQQRFSESDQDILVYIHGYNVTFEDAMLRGAQIAVDFDFKGLPVAFTWPSNGRTASYASDWADALWSAHYLEIFLAELKAQFGDRRIHIVSHSMGNKVLLHAMRQMAARGVDAGIENVILCAPDFDAQFFVEQIADPIRPLAEHWTIYTSENDLALNISSKLSSAPRLGSPNPLVDGYEIIDASKIEVSPWSVPENHSYYAVKSRVIDDIAAVLAGVRPDARGLLRREVSKGSLWAF